MNLQEEIQEIKKLLKKLEPPIIKIICPTKLEMMAYIDNIKVGYAVYNCEEEYISNFHYKITNNLKYMIYIDKNYSHHVLEIATLLFDELNKDVCSFYSGNVKNDLHILDRITYY